MLSVRAMRRLQRGKAGFDLFKVCEAACLTEGGKGSREKGGLV
ncbi:hypothetical protein [Cytobacillus oceanisediminis]|nr:hypothetical protein [Cytobacillus oceanisediminis]